MLNSNQMVFNQTFSIIHNIIASNIVNWASLLKHLLSSLGFHEVWVNQGVGNYNAFIGFLKLRLTDTFIQNWRSRLEESSRAIFYKTIAVSNATILRYDKY